MTPKKSNSVHVQQIFGEAFEVLLNHAIASNLISGMSIGLLRDGNTSLVTAGTGVAVDSSFEIGSITKTFTCELLNRLIDRRKLRWDDPLESFLPQRPHPVASLPSDGTPITLGDLATHRSGLPLLPPNLKVPDVLNPYGTYSENDLVQYLSQTKLTRSQDQPYQYSNLGYVALGFVLEQASGKPYADLLREEILNPLELTAELALTGHSGPSITQGHTQAGRPVSRWRQQAFAPAGGLCSTVPDMLRWCRFLISQNRLTSAESNIALNAGYAKDWYSHDGLTGGFSTFIGINSQTKSAVVLLSNRRSPGVMHAIAANAIRALHGDSLVPLSGNYGKYRALVIDTVRQNPISSSLMSTIRSSRSGAVTIGMLRRLMEAS